MATIRGREFVNRGYAAGPMCFVYGFSALTFTIGFADLAARPGYLFFGCAVTGAAIEWRTAKLLEHTHHQRWWDYSDKKFNIDGYICLQYTLLWGLLGTVAVLWSNGWLARLYALLPTWLGKALVWTLVVLATLDAVASSAVMARRPDKRLEELNRMLEGGTLALQQRISARVERRIRRAYPYVQRQVEAAEQRAEREVALGEMVWLFTLGSLIGDIVETIFCRIRGGVWMSRSSLVWGPFSVIWGMALVLTTILLHSGNNGQGEKNERSDASIFVMGAMMGGAYEYICSALGELVFGVVFWDYSEMPFNLGGRINLLYCFFWGIAAVVWLKWIYPPLSRLIGSVRKNAGRWLTILLAVFMTLNMAVSALALIRYDARTDGIPAANRLEEILDARFDDERMERIYPNAVKR